MYQPRSERTWRLRQWPVKQRRLKPDNTNQVFCSLVDELAGLQLQPTNYPFHLTYFGGHGSEWLVLQKIPWNTVGE
jgi:hypothetical protein